MSSIGGGTATSGGAGFRLAPDLTYPSSKNSTNNFMRISPINASESLTTVLSLTGKFVLSHLVFSDQSAETNRYVLTVDGVVIWDASKTASTISDFFLGKYGAAPDIPIVCNTSILVQVKTTSDATITLVYLARPIL